MNPLTAEIATAQNSDNKLILIIGGPGSGKSKLIHDYIRSLKMIVVKSSL